MITVGKNNIEKIDSSKEAKEGIAQNRDSDCVTGYFFTGTSLSNDCVWVVSDSIFRNWI